MFLSFKKIIGIWCLSIWRELYDLLHYCTAFVNVYMNLGWGQGFVSSMSPGIRPVSIVSVYLVVQTLCQNTAASPSLAGGWILLPCSFQMGQRQNILLWQVVSVCSHFNSTEVNLFLAYFSLSGAFLKNALQKDCSWYFLSVFMMAREASHHKLDCFELTEFKLD